MKIIIPMSGTGKRFVEAGYTKIKPLIEIDGKPIIEHVINMFPGVHDFVFVCNSEHLAKTELRQVLERAVPRGTIVSIAPHKLGPVFAALQAEHLIDDEEPVIVNYCDFSARWDFEDFQREVSSRKCAGCITAYRGFHPHSLGPTYYAYMREKDRYLLEIKEKGCFTDNRMQEFASSGTYYFSKGAYVKKYFKEVMERKIDLNGEYYISLVYNLLLEDNLDVFIYELEKFLQWGTPDDVEEYLSWSQYFKDEWQWRPKRFFGAQNLVPMAGMGKRFSDEGYTLPKPLIPVEKTPMVVAATRSVPLSDSYIFVCQKEHLQSSNLEQVLRKEFGAKTQFVPIDYMTEGQACTCLLAEQLLDKEAPLFISACDNAMVWDEEEFARLITEPSVDCVVFTFRNYVGAKRNPQMYGWVKSAEGVVKEVSVKTPLSNTPGKDPAIVGAFWFRKARYFLDAANDLIARNERINHEFYVDSCINALLRQGRHARIFDLQRYICWGTPNDLRTWEYWHEYFHGAKKQAEAGDSLVEGFAANL